MIWGLRKTQRHEADWVGRVQSTRACCAIDVGNSIDHALECLPPERIGAFQEASPKTGPLLTVTLFDSLYNRAMEHSKADIRPSGGM